MPKYDDDYFFLRCDDDNERAPFMRPDPRTVERRYQTIRPPTGSPPLVFTNGFKERFVSEQVTADFCDVMFDGATFIVRDKIGEHLLQLAIPNVWLHPAVYIDDADVWHEDFWYVGFDGFLDCWDRATSQYNKTPYGTDLEPLYSVRRYSLNASVLDKIRLKNRLLFRMGGDTNGRVVCHLSMVKLFQNGCLIQSITT